MKKQHVENLLAGGLTRQQYYDMHAIAFHSMREWIQDIVKAERSENDSGQLPYISPQNLLL